jgi:hypothetical protein
MYPLQTQNDYTELRYSLRSVEKYLPGAEVIIVGDTLPDWITGITQIEVKDTPGRKQLNIRRKILAALEYSKEIFFLSDDVYLLKAPEYKFYKHRTLKQNGESGAKPLTDQLTALNKPIDQWDVHCPIVYEREKFRALDIFASECIIKSMYCNYHEIEGVIMPDFKVNSKMTAEQIKNTIKDRPYFSTSPVGLKYALPVLEELFDRKSNFEL